MALSAATIFKHRPVPASRISGRPAAGMVDLPQLTEDANEVLFSLSNIFPFDLFPDRIIIRKNHVDIVKGIFFWSGATERLQIIDIREIGVHYNPVFATIVIHAIGPPEIRLEIRFLWRHQALRAKRIILGLLECQQQQVDLSGYGKRDLIAHVEEIGRAKN
jgi:hypothetical protein